MYDTAGGVQINRLNDVLATAFAQDPTLGLQPDLRCRR